MSIEGEKSLTKILLLSVGTTNARSLCWISSLYRSISIAMFIDIKEENLYLNWGTLKVR